MTLTLSEAKAVLRLIKESEKDPFTYRSGGIDTDDLRSVGLDIQDDGAGGGGTADTSGASDSSHSGGKMISPSVAVTAPDATPTMGDDAPPPEIENALQVFNDPDAEAPSAAPVGGGKDYDAIARALIGGVGPDDDDDTDPLPPAPSSGAFESSNPVDPSVAPAGNIVDGLKEARARAKKEKMRKLQERRQSR